ncbi:unnamed protein product [Schistosoma margrebowiei]|uniref:Uncharacterized protein n=1 Tax=Schistosoma margrebowiei TaxID=48269 RepID=A0AA85AG84_9TREM|nr:unnamed protein product [Schistosoma margrebowiei]
MFPFVVIIFALFEGINGGGKAPMLISIPRDLLPKDTVTEVEPTWEIITTTIEPTIEESDESSTIYEILLNLLHKLWALVKYLLDFM